MFARTQIGVDRLVEQLATVGVRAGGAARRQDPAGTHPHAGRVPEGRTNVLVATDVAARGIHVDGVSLVVHVDPPKDAKDYLHRAGRTARAGESGAVVTLVLPKQRRTTQAMMVKAGVAPAETRVRLGDPGLEEITGAREPSGVPVGVFAPIAVAPPVAVGAAVARRGHGRHIRRGHPPPPVGISGRGHGRPIRRGHGRSAYPPRSRSAYPARSPPRARRHIRPGRRRDHGQHIRPGRRGHGRRTRPDRRRGRGRGIWSVRRCGRNTVANAQRTAWVRRRQLRLVDDRDSARLTGSGDLLEPWVAQPNTSLGRIHACLDDHGLRTAALVGQHQGDDAPDSPARAVRPPRCR